MDINDNNYFENPAQYNHVKNALQAANFGFPVFPVNPKDKTPLVNDWPSAATQDAATIHAWWKQFPEAMVGALTGEASGIFVLDIDVSEGENPLSKFQKLSGNTLLPDTLTVSTPSGGMHLYFRMPPNMEVRNSASKLGEGIDIRGTGGYIIFLGSRRSDGKSYQLASLEHAQTIAPAPDWLLAAIANPHEILSPTQERKGTSLFAPGRRNLDMTAVAGLMRRHGGEADDIAGLLLSLNNGLRNPLAKSEIQNIAGSISKYEISPDCFTHVDFASRLAPRLEGKVLYCIGHGFYCFNGKQWSEDKEELQVLVHARNFANEIFQDVDSLSENSRTKDNLLKERRKLKSEDFLKSSLRMLKSEASIQVKFEDFDKNRNLINLRNGTYDLLTGKLGGHSPNDRLTHMLDFDYEPNFNAPHFGKFMADVLTDENAEFLLRVFGYALKGTGEEQKFFVFHGKGKNGKSTLVNAILSVFGSEFSVNISPESLNGRLDGQIRNDLVRLMNKRIMVTQETKAGGLLDAPLIKTITGGDMLTARKLYQEPIEFKPVCVPFIITNFLPVIDGSDSAMGRRICVIKFDRVIEEDKLDTALEQKLAAERPGIFNRLLEGLRQYRVKGLDIPNDVQDATKAFISTSNLTKEFFEDCLEEDVAEKVSASDLYQTYRHWAENGGYKPMSMVQFKAAFERETGFEQKRDSGGRYWLGLKLKRPEVPEWQPGLF